MDPNLVTADTPLNNTAIISLFDKGMFLNPLAWRVAFRQVSVWMLFLFPAEQRCVATWLTQVSLMPNANVHLPVTVVIDRSNVMLHSVCFFVGPPAPNAFLQSWVPYQHVWAELLLLHPSGTYGPWVVNHIASLCFELWGLKPMEKKGFHFSR